MRRSTPVLAALLLVLAAACGAPLRVGTSGDYPPFSMRTPSGELQGFDVEVARAYADDRGRSLELVPFRWPDLTAKLGAGEFDVAMSGVTVRGDRLARHPMTAAVARADAVLVVREGDAPVPGEAKPSARGARGTAASPGAVAVNRGGHLEQVARSTLANADLRTVEDNTTLPAILARGDVDGVVTDTLELHSFGDGFRVARVLQRDRKGYWVRDEELRRDLDAWLAEKEADGTLARLREHYLGGASASPLPDGELRAVDLVGRRLALMPLVASAKRARNLPIDAPARESVVEERLLTEARAAGLCPEPYRELVRAQIEAAKAVQRATKAKDDRSSAAPPFDLEGDLRPAIDRLDTALLFELVRAAPFRGSEADLVTALQADATAPGVSDAERRRLATALRAQRVQPCGSVPGRDQDRTRSPPSP
jgi:cyclohexadienyl dehydratase